MWNVKTKRFQPGREVAHPTSVFRQKKQQHMERERISCSMQQVSPLCPWLQALITAMGEDPRSRRLYVADMYYYLLYDL